MSPIVRTAIAAAKASSRRYRSHGPYSTESYSVAPGRPSRAPERCVSRQPARRSSGGSERESGSLGRRRGCSPLLNLGLPPDRHDAIMSEHEQALRALIGTRCPMMVRPWRSSDLPGTTPRPRAEPVQRRSSGGSDTDDWRVRTTKLWMNIFSAARTPAFSWNHDVVMRQGGYGLAERLGARLVAHD